MLTPRPARSSTISEARVGERSSTSTWQMPEYRRLEPSPAGQAQTSSVEKSSAAAQSATAVSGSSANGAVSRPSFMRYLRRSVPGQLTAAQRPSRALAATASVTRTTWSPSAKVG